MKQDLIDKTLKIIESKGIEGVSMRGLAKKMSLSPMATYRHFSSKDELLLEVAARGFELLTSHGERAARAESSAQKRLEAVCFAYYRFGHEHQNLFELMFGPIKKHEKLSEHFRQSARRSFATFAEYVGEFAVDQVRRDRFPYQTAAGLWSYLHGTTVLVINGYLSALEASPRELEQRVRWQIAAAIKALVSK